MIPLTVPNLMGKEREYLDDCIATTYVSSVGGYVNRLERMVAESTGSKYAVATSSGTTGLHVVLTAVGVKPGELVIIPTFTFIASANSVSHCGAVPWCMDVGEDDWCMNSTLVCEALGNECEKRNGDVIHKKSGRRVAAIMTVYTLGNIPDMETLRIVADEYGLPLVADAACAVGATYKGQPFGTFADVSVISFNGNKTITCGGGGMVVGSNPELMGRIRHLTTTAKIGEEYDFDMVGFNYRMTNIQAAVGCAQMERLNEFVSVKKRIRETYARKLEGGGISFFPTTIGGSCWLSGVVLSEEKHIDDTRRVCRELRILGIESRTFWKPVHLQAPYRNIIHSQMKVSENLWERVVTLPCSTNITEKELELVVKSVKEVLKF